MDSVFLSPIRVQLLLFLIGFTKRLFCFPKKNSINNPFLSTTQKLKQNSKATLIFYFRQISRWQDLNLWPSVPKTVALPDCATSWKQMRTIGFEPITIMDVILSHKRIPVSPSALYNMNSCVSHFFCGSSLSKFKEKNSSEEPLKFYGRDFRVERLLFCFNKRSFCSLKKNMVT